MIRTLIIVLLILALIGALPNWNYSRKWGYTPSGIIATLIIVYLILTLLGRI